MQKISFANGMINAVIFLVLYMAGLSDTGNPHIAFLIAAVAITIVPLIPAILLVPGYWKANGKLLLIGVPINLVGGVLFIAAASYLGAQTWADPKWGSVGLAVFGLFVMKIYHLAQVKGLVPE